MRTVLAVAAREVAERRALVLVALVVGCAPLLAYPEWRDLVALSTFPTMVLVAAVTCGASVIARDLADGRLGFFFARPVPWWSIWGGKMMAAVVLTLGTCVVVSLPMMIAGGRRLSDVSPWDLSLLLPFVLAILALSHAAAVVYRSRDNWAALDFAILAMLAWAAIWSWRTVAFWRAAPADAGMAAAAAWTVAVAGLAASAVHMARGRADIRRSHRVLSIVLWSVLSVAVAAFFGYAVWISSPGPRDLKRLMSASAAPVGPWVLLRGFPAPPRQVVPPLLLNLHSRRFVRVLWPNVSFSADGTRAAWAGGSREPRYALPRLVVADLGADDATTRELPLPVPIASVRALTLSPDGGRVAVVQERQVAVFDVGSEAVRVALPLHDARVTHAVFTADGRVRVLKAPLHTFATSDLQIVELDPTTRRTETIGRVPIPGNPSEFWSPDASRLVIMHQPRPRTARVELYDGSNGTSIATLTESARSAFPLFLADGRVVVVEGGATTRLRIFSAAGAETAAVEVHDGFANARLAEVEPGIVVAAFRTGEHWRAMFVDATTGAVIRGEDGLYGSADWFDRRAARPRPGSEGARLFIDDAGALVRFDFRAGTRATLLGGAR